MRLTILLLATILCGCAVLTEDKREDKIPDGFPPPPPKTLKNRSLRLAAMDISRDTLPAPSPLPSPQAFTDVPGGLSFTSIKVTDQTITLNWNAPGVFTLSCGPTPSGPWSAISNTSSPAVIPNLKSNYFYQLSQSSLKVTRYPIAPYGAGAFAGDNDIAFMVGDLHWSQSSTDDLLILTNGILYPILMTAPGMPPCAPFTIATDVQNRKIYSVEGSCYQGPFTGPYILRTWQLDGQEGYFDSVTAIAAHTFGAFFDHWGDMIMLQSGALVVAWKGNSSGYCFKYCSPSGVWQSEICISNIPAASSHMTLGQIPNGEVVCFIVRDGQSGVLAQPSFREIDGQLVFNQTYWLLPMEGEIPYVITITDYANDRLLVSRNTTPHYLFDDAPFIKGSAQRVASMPRASSFADSPYLPDPYEVPLSVLNYNEPVNQHAAALCKGKYWLIRQEFSPTTFNFSLVYAQERDGDHWGEKYFLYQTSPCGNCRGQANNWLTSYRNSEREPRRLLFANVDESGKSVIFELFP